MTTLRSSPSIAYCFYGQYRTADYCLPWLSDMVKATHKCKAIFVSTKARSTYPNSHDSDGEVMLSPTEVASKLRAYWPQAHVDVDCVQHKLLNPARGYWNYARLFWSMNKAYSMYCDWAAENGDVDVLIFHRLDALSGPTSEMLPAHFHAQKEISPFEIWSDGGNIRFYYNEFGAGVADLTLAGAPFALGTVLSYCTESLVNNPYGGWGRYMVGPNIHLKDAIDACSLSVRKLPGEVALVRPTADLTTPVRDSFHYHATYWRSQHRGNNERLK